MNIEIFSDVVCPWCAIGKRRFERALARFDHSDEVNVVWRAFELDPGAPAVSERDLASHLAAKYGMTRDKALSSQARLSAIAEEEGLEFNFGSAWRANTFDAHRLLHYGLEVGLQDALKERLFRAYFTEGEVVSDRATLVRLGAEVGFEQDKVSEILATDRFADEVRSDEAEAQALGISGVPFFVVDGRYGISGAQQPEVILDALEKVWADAHPSLTVLGSDESAICTDESCEIPN